MFSRKKTTREPAETFAAHLERAKSSGRALLDLTESDPARCGLGWSVTELEAILADVHGDGRATAQALSSGRDAVASYLAGRGVSVAPDRIQLARSRASALRLALKAVCEEGDEILVASPGDPSIDAIAAAESVRVGCYALAYDGAWRVDRRSLAKAVIARTRAILVGNPSEPTGALVDREDLAWVEQLCSLRGIALIGDEAFVDTAVVPVPSVLAATRCLVLHLSGLSGICGLPRFGAEWLAVSGPDALVAPAVARLQEPMNLDSAVPGSVQVAVPALLARREQFLAPLRRRLAENRGAIASAALRESPWSLQWGRGGHWAVLEIGAAREDQALCLALLDDGVAVFPGTYFGFPASGYLVVSLLPSPEIFREALSLLDQRLRRPLLAGR
jgi:aspartate/methionine/tyrosine aminotransferase